MSERPKYQPGVVPEALLPFSIPPMRELNMVEMNGISVYAPREFKATTLMIGDGKSEVALCTGWADPWQVVDRESIESFSIVGPLRTPMGINVLLWNLANNPQITHLGIWAGTSLDTTEKGVVARSHLVSLWENGVDSEGRIIGTDFRLLPELVENGGLEIIDQLRRNIALYDWSGISESQLKAVADSLPKAHLLREGHTFPEFKIEVPETFPSEEVAIRVTKEKLFDGWIALVDRIARYGRATQLETGGALVKELEFAEIVINSEDSSNFFFPQWVSEVGQLNISPTSLHKYYETKILPHPYMSEIYPGVYKFIRGPKDPAYLYSELMFAFPRSQEIDRAADWILNQGGIGPLYRYLSENYQIDQDRQDKAIEVLNAGIPDEDKAEILLELYIPPVNQVAKAIDRIRIKPDDADKTVILWDPFVHGIRDRSRPCLMYVDLLVRDGRIDMQTIWRSHDIAKGWPENLYGMLRLLGYISEQTGYKPGRIVSISQSAHIYLSDFTWIDEVRKTQFVSNIPRPVFDEQHEADPRGNVSIGVIGKEIVFVLQHPQTAQPLLELRGTYRQIQAQLKHLELFSIAGHMVDIGAELEKAEICRLLSFPYIQDKPLNLERLMKD